ncbi:MAG: ribonuclease PH [Deltaproteobacteria bacterium]|nr:ribonuclease PH [Deltaproteobacteria bacterium]
MRSDQRENNQLRAISISTGYQKFADGSALIRWGETWVLCAASIDKSVPRFRADSGGGWVTAEYNMLPGSTSPRKGRRTGGREKEIQRLIGRSLRASIDLQTLGEHTITIDCDVLQADGGTRVASITGGYVALVLAARKLLREGALEAMPALNPVAAVSVGIVDDEPRLDLPYVEDSAAQVDMNVVMTTNGKLIEVQGTAEHGTFDRAELDALLDLAGAGVEQLGQLQLRTLAASDESPEVTVTLP